MTGHEQGVPPGGTPDNTPVRPVVVLTAQWAEDVGRALLHWADDAERKGLSPPAIDEVWVGADLALYVRYRVGAIDEVRVGRRVPNSHIDPTSSGYAESAEKQGFAYLYDLQGPPFVAWVDRLGYQWYCYGPTPQESWEFAVEQQPRLVTLRARNGEAS